MTNILVPTPAAFVSVHRTDTWEPVLGGSDTSPEVLPHTELAERDQYLLDQMTGETFQIVKHRVVILATGTWTCPTDVVSIEVTAQAPGGGGAGGTSGGTARYGGGGGEGGRIQRCPLTVVPGTVYTITVGAPGTAGPWQDTTGAPPAANHGGDGGNVTFGALLTATGGKGGPNFATAGTFGGASGTVTVSGLTLKTNDGHPVTAVPFSAFWEGWGGGPGGGARATTTSFSSDGVAQTGSGGGGGAPSSTYGAGGAGGSGYVIIDYTTITPVFP